MTLSRLPPLESSNLSGSAYEVETLRSSSRKPNSNVSSSLSASSASGFDRLQHDAVAAIQIGTMHFNYAVRREIVLAFVNRNCTFKSNHAADKLSRDNYYVARANALEDNVAIYHTIKGQRVAFKGVKETVKSGAWHTLRVDFEGNKFVVTFDGKKVIEAVDESFKDAGKAGVWTKADSVTLFDDFSYGEK